MHKASPSRRIVEDCKDKNIHTIVVEYNKDWKRDLGLGKVTVILTEESYTSGTSFLDGEEPVKKNYKFRRNKYKYF